MYGSIVRVLVCKCAKYYIVLRISTSYLLTCCFVTPELLQHIIYHTIDENDTRTPAVEYGGTLLYCHEGEYRTEYFQVLPSSSYIRLLGITTGTRI